jgi:hypothetical protein
LALLPDKSEERVAIDGHSHSLGVQADAGQPLAVEPAPEGAQAHTGHGSRLGGRQQGWYGIPLSFHVETLLVAGHKKARLSGGNRVNDQE